MRISDWSSDVCSSDLQRTGFECVEFGITEHRPERGDRFAAVVERSLDVGMRGRQLRRLIIGADGARRQRECGGYEGTERGVAEGVHAGAGVWRIAGKTEEARVGTEGVCMSSSGWEEKQYK